MSDNNYDRFEIRQMNIEEISIPIEYAHREGWNPGLEDGFCFYNTDPKGFFIALLNDKPIGTASAVAYNNDFGFIGFYIIEPEFRKNIYGMMLGKKALEYMGGRNIGIDGVVERVENYKNIGFIYSNQNIRYCLKNLKFEIDKSITEVKHIDFDKILKYDTKHFPVERKIFLSNWLKMKNSLALAVTSQDEILGYGVIRKCFNGYKIGPLFAENYEIADTLFRGLTSYSNNDEVFLDIPEPNEMAKQLVKKYNMVKVFETVRMYLKEIPNLPLQNIFGITSFELG